MMGRLAPSVSVEMRNIPKLTKLKIWIKLYIKNEEWSEKKGRQSNAVVIQRMNKFYRQKQQIGFLEVKKNLNWKLKSFSDMI